MSKVICLDCDDVLASLAPTMSKVLEDATGISIHWKDWDSFNLTKRYNLDTNKFSEILICSECLNIIPPVDGARNVLNYLKRCGYEIVIISARNYHPLGKQITEQWLTKHALQFDKVFISGGQVKKSDICKQFGEIEAFVDDNIDNCIDMRDNTNCKQIFLKTMPWNVKDTQFDRISSIDKLMNFL